MTTTPPRYFSAVIALGLTLPQHGAYVVQVRHDAWCALLAHRGACDCQPDVALVPQQIGGAA